MQKIIVLSFALVVMATAFACGGDTTGGGVSGSASSPTEAYKQLFAAVKARDIEAIKSNMSKKTLPRWVPSDITSPPNRCLKTA